jgi:hypothetical protein
MGISMHINLRRNHVTKHKSDKRRNIRRQFGTFNVNENNKNLLTPKKQRREDKKLARKIEKKAKKASKRSEREHQMNVEDDGDDQKFNIED